MPHCQRTGNTGGGAIDERKKYYKQASKANANHETYLSIIIDVMDQNKTYLRHFLYNGKFLSNMWKLRLNLLEQPYNICLLQCFLMLDTLPDTLYLQMDNCPGQNKNRLF
nr:uncharacterized protein LOC117686322 [Crassostrea gigas]